MSSSKPPQYFKNDLQPVQIDAITLRSVLDELRASIRQGLNLIMANFKELDHANHEVFGKISNGVLGLALMFLRLHSQAKYLANGVPLYPNLFDHACMYMNFNSKELSLVPGRPTVLCHPILGAIVLRILANEPDMLDSEGKLIDRGPTIEDDITALHDAVRIALRQGIIIEIEGRGSIGGDEALSGRAGLLWALLNIRKHTFSDVTRSALQPTLDLIPELTQVILQAGKLGAMGYESEQGVEAPFPLMWYWINEYYGLGAMHGATGILTILMSCHPSEIETDLHLIAQTITAICRLSAVHNGHLPMSIPAFESETTRASPLVQICHGAPGLLLLLGAARRHKTLGEYRTQEHEEAVRLCSERVWEEGLLSKGGGLCHGIAGNAWPWLTLAAAELENRAQVLLEENSAADHFLSRALALLLHARETTPFKTEEESKYRMPDHPFSLFEGLAGTVCAWSEACVLITARLKLMDMAAGEGIHDERSAFRVPDMQGFPGLGGFGVFGLL